MQEFFAGLDIGRRFHMLAVVNRDGKRIFKRRFYNTEKTLTEMVGRVKSKTKSGRVYWAIEMSDANASLVVRILARAQQALYQSTPYRLKRFKEATAQPRKSDPIDAVALANLLRLRRRELVRVHLPSKTVLALRRLTRHVKRLTDQRSRLINQLQEVITRYCPDLVVNWPGENFACKTMLTLLMEYPDIASMASMTDVELLDKVRKLSRKRFGEKHVAALKEAAESLLKTDGVMETEAMIVRDVVEQIADINGRISMTDAKIEEILPQFEVADRLMLLPGISKRIAAIIIAEVGDIRNFATEAKLATFAGLTPICRQSGSSKETHRLARQTNKHLLNAMYIAAMVSVGCYAPSKRYYDRKLSNTPRAYADTIRAFIALARQRCKIIFKILTREGFVYQLERDKPPQADIERDVEGSKAVDAVSGPRPASSSQSPITEQDGCETALLLQQGTPPFSDGNISSSGDMDMTN